MVDDRPVAEPDAIAAALQALQAHGVDRRDPVRWHFVAALQRRASQQQGPLRQQVDLRLARALADLQQRHRTAAPAAVSAPPSPTRSSPLAGLLLQLGSGVATPPTELQAVRRFSHTWARLRVDQQLARALARQPDNAGPLNSQRLMLQTLQRLRQLSPAYLQRFMAHADALLWLEDRGGDGPARQRPALPAPGPGRRARARTGR